MTRPSGPLRTFLLLLTAGGASLLLGFGAVTVTAALGAPADRELGDAVVLDPATVTTPTPGKPGAPADRPAAGDRGTTPGRAPAPNPAPAPNKPAPNPAPAPAPPHAPAPTHVSEHQPQQVVPVPPSSADGEHRTRG